MRIIIAGGRDFNDYGFLDRECSKILFEFSEGREESDYIPTLEIISGKANGADSLGERFAKTYKIKVKEFPADWNNLKAIPCKIKNNKFGKPYNALAGHNRNEQMALYTKEENGILIAFHDGKSTGTKNMIDLAKKHGLRVFVINY